MRPTVGEREKKRTRRESLSEEKRGDESPHWILGKAERPEPKSATSNLSSPSPAEEAKGGNGVKTSKESTGRQIYPRRGNFLRFSARIICSTSGRQGAWRQNEGRAVRFFTLRRISIVRNTKGERMTGVGGAKKSSSSFGVRSNRRRGSGGAVYRRGRRWGGRSACGTPPLYKPNS